VAIPFLLLNIIFNNEFIPPSVGGTIDLSNQDPPTSPGPSGTAAKDELEIRGWTVLVDPDP
jgi:hypothetical protein